MQFNITRGKITKPRITGIYGPPFVGKTTWASHAPSPLILQVEEGANDLETPKTDLIKTWPEFMDICRELYSEEDLQYKTIIVDSLDALERLMWDYVVENGGEKINNIEDFGYGKGYMLALGQWQSFKVAMTALRDKGLNIVCIAHAHIKKFTPPDGEDYDRYEPRFHHKAVATIVEWCDEFFFANFVVKTAQSGDDKSKHKGIGKGERILHCQQRPAYTAKNRLNMPEKIPMEWAAYQEYITPSQKEN